MSMQRRLLRRHNSDFFVTLFQQDSKILICNTVNISSDGMFIKSGSVILLRKTNLKIGFDYQVNGKMKAYKLPVEVIYYKHDGIGLQFKKILSESDVYIHTLLGSVAHSKKISNEKIYKTDAK